MLRLSNTLILISTLLHLVKCDEGLLQSQLPAALQPDPHAPRPAVQFIAKGLDMTMSTLALAKAASCGSAARSIFDGSQHLIQSSRYPANVDVGSCTWSFDVQPGVNVDVMCEVIDAACAAGNELSIQSSIDGSSRMCTQTPLVDQRISLRTHDTTYRLVLTHTVRRSPTGRLSCTVRGVGGQGDPAAEAQGGNRQKKGSAVRLAQADCGRTKYSSTKIVNGQEAKQNAYPWMVYLVLGSSACGGTVISDRWVLTAAHCAVVANPSAIRVFTGCHTLSAASCDAARTVSSKVVHSGYDGRTLANDIALLRLSSPVAAFSDRVRPVCLPLAEVAGQGYRMTTTGWGLTSTNGRPSTVLKEAVVQSITAAECRKSYDIGANVLCVKAVTGATCSGDSGGFLGSQRQAGRFEQDGITSFGSSRGCGIGLPDGFTYVRGFLQWIHANAQL